MFKENNLFLHPRLRYLLQKREGWRKQRHLGQVSSLLYEINQAFSFFGDNYLAEGGFCSDFIDKSQVGMEPQRNIQTIPKAGF